MAPSHQRGARLTVADARRQGRVLEWVTVGWNTTEVFVTVGLGLAAGSLALVAFGLDSLVEVFASLVVIWHIRETAEGVPGARATTGGPREATPESAVDQSEQRRRRRALRLVAAAFAALALYLLVASTHAIVGSRRPGESPVGIAYLGLTAVVMFTLARRKKLAGKAADSDPLLAEASLTFLDGCLSTGILAALVSNALWGWWWADPLAAAVVAVFCLREARESWVESGQPAL